ncbi:BNR/Asp-box repeats-containing protein [Candidatus Nitrosocosmicus franklandus]|uniref:BNR/Asp-box repeats-containing protein n=1 Tax=Candidatus Nitrosocosmicus franklandianus TaxID=1798806 RepID=A0A484ID44_9ARCH|nr:BNR/Asp-box repeats-containing protein [Candidatus Nitrosocosmicus franklandus]
MFLHRKQNYLYIFCLLTIFSTLSLLAVDTELLSYSQVKEGDGDEYNNIFVIQNVSDNLGDSVYPQTESSENKVFVVWQDNLFGHNRMNYDILFKTSNDGGQTFGDVINLSNNTGFSEHPQMAVNGNNVYIVWADDTSLNREIYFITSNDGGQTFGDVINLSNNTADSYNQEISVSGDNVYVVWQDAQKLTQGNSSISFIASNDGGQTFGDVINLSNNAGKTSFPKISSSQENVYIAWNIDSGDRSIVGVNNTEGGIFFVKSHDNGSSFDNEIRLNTNEKPGELQIDTSDNNVYVVWGSPDPSTTNHNSAQALTNENISTDNLTGDGIYFTKSTDNGNSFTKPSFIQGQFLNPLNVDIIHDSDKLIVAIQATPLDNTVEGNQDIFLMGSQNMGDSFFSESVNISNNAGISECPSMTILSSDNKLFVVWQDRSPGNNEALSIKTNL